jgi:hypothetical protein
MRINLQSVISRRYDQDFFKIAFHSGRTSIDVTDQLQELLAFCTMADAMTQ